MRTVRTIRQHLDGSDSARFLSRSIERRENFELHNYQASTTMQSASGTSTIIWERGIRGEGQVVGLADSVRWST